MQIISVKEVGKDLSYKWPDSSIETYPDWITYTARSDQGLHEVTVAFGTRKAYGKKRVRIVVLIDGY